MNVIVVGCGRVGAELAYRLYQRGNQVSVIDPDPGTFANLPADFYGRTIEGEATNREVLHRAGIADADALAAVTNSDADNAVVAHVARALFHIGNVVVRNYEPHWRPLHEAFGLQVVSPSSWGAQRIEEVLIHSSMHAVFSAGNGEVEVYEFVVPVDWDGHRLEELLDGCECMPVALARAGKATLPAPDSLLRAGDIVNLSATAQGIESVRQRLETRREV